MTVVYDGKPLYTGILLFFYNNTSDSVRLKCYFLAEYICNNSSIITVAERKHSFISESVFCIEYSIREGKLSFADIFCFYVVEETGVFILKVEYPLYVFGVFGNALNTNLSASE